MPRVFLWLFVISSGILLVAAGMQILGLLSPRFGPRLLGSMWPGHFSTPHHQRIAKRRILLHVGSNVGQTLGILLVFFVAQTPSGVSITVGSIGVVLIGLAALCSLYAWRLQQQLKARR